MLLLLAACNASDPNDTWVPPGCGDGVVDSVEACDDGSENSDSEPDACRTDCSLPTCGDGVVDTQESCEDGNEWGADGCSPTCQAESFPAETEPNDLDLPQEWTQSVIGTLDSPQDRDCFTVSLPEAGYIQAEVSGPSGTCPDPLLLELFDPAQGLIATGSPNEAKGCSPIDPTVEPGARFVDAGTWTVCARPFAEDGIVHSYTLDILVGTDSCELELEQPADADPDGDGKVGDCDDDDDGDGYADVDDNCPDVPNGGAAAPLAPNTNGLLADWLVLGPLGLGSSPQDCLPTESALSPSDAESEPVLGLAELGEIWRVRSGDERLDYTTDLGSIPDPPREAYSVLWLRSDSEQELTLAVGADDGAYVWLNGEEVMAVDSCQGTNLDQFQEPVTLQAGWNRLTTKVYDQGGGWGLYARFLDADGNPVTDLEISLQANTSWAPDQTDTDGDGLGDVCDPTPGGEG